MKPAQWLSLALLTVPLLLGGCKGESADKSKGGSVKEYDLQGKVMAVDPNKPAVTLDHEDIPGLMKAMEMEFVVEDAKLLEGIKVGDKVKGRVKKTESFNLITRLEKR
jgi:protein SCO1/2